MKTFAKSYQEPSRMHFLPDLHHIRKNIMLVQKKMHGLCSFCIKGMVKRWMANREKKNSHQSRSVHYGKGDLRFVRASTTKEIGISVYIQKAKAHSGRCAILLVWAYKIIIFREKCEVGNSRVTTPDRAIKANPRWTTKPAQPAEARWSRKTDGNYFCRV